MKPDAKDAEVERVASAILAGRMPAGFESFEAFLAPLGPTAADAGRALDKAVAEGRAPVLHEINAAILVLRETRRKLESSPLPGGMEEFLGDHPAARSFRELDVIFAAHAQREPAAREPAPQPPAITVTHRPDLDRQDTATTPAPPVPGTSTPLALPAPVSSWTEGSAPGEIAGPTRPARQPGRDEHGVPRRELVHELGPTFPALLGPRPVPTQGDEARDPLDAAALAEILGKKRDGDIAVALQHMLLVRPLLWTHPRAHVVLACALQHFAFGPESLTPALSALVRAALAKLPDCIPGSST
jgi:hypothetical protein